VIGVFWVLVLESDSPGCFWLWFFSVGRDCCVFYTRVWYPSCCRTSRTAEFAFSGWISGSCAYFLFTLSITDDGFVSPLAVVSSQPAWPDESGFLGTGRPYCPAGNFACCSDVLLSSNSGVMATVGIITLVLPIAARIDERLLFEAGVLDKVRCSS
jgi:hypothetical protein